MIAIGLITMGRCHGGVPRQRAVARPSSSVSGGAEPAKSTFPATKSLMPYFVRSFLYVTLAPAQRLPYASLNLSRTSTWLLSPRPSRYCLPPHRTGICVVEDAGTDAGPGSAALGPAG